VRSSISDFNQDTNTNVTPFALSGSPNQHIEPRFLTTTDWGYEYSLEDPALLVFDSANRLACDFTENHIGRNIYSSSAPNSGYVGDVQDAFTHPLASYSLDAVPEDFQLGDFNAVATSTTVDLSSPIFNSADASRFQSSGAQDAWDQTPEQNDAASGYSWGQSMGSASFNPTFQPLNPDEGFIINDLGLTMPWSPDTSMEGHFQHGVGFNSVASSNQWLNGNTNWNSAASMNDSNLSPASSMTASALALAPAPAPPAITNARIPCTHLTCTRTFKRHFERTRHEASVHRTHRQRYLCPITGCPKSQGKAYSRADKVTEHLWKKHANLGYMKS
jgi:hypothetical protein